MSDYDKRIADEIARHAEKIATLKREAEIAATLPIEPYMIHCGGMFRDRPWLSYKVDTLAEAIRISDAYPEKQDVSAVEDGHLVSLSPVGGHPERYAGKRERWRVPQAICLRQHGGRGFYTAGVEFWTAHAGSRYFVSIEVRQMPHHLRVGKRVRYDQWGTRATLDSSTARPSSPRARRPGSATPAGLQNHSTTEASSAAPSTSGCSSRDGGHADGKGADHEEDDDGVDVEDEMPIPEHAARVGPRAREGARAARRRRGRSRDLPAGPAPGRQPVGCLDRPGHAVELGHPVERLEPAGAPAVDAGRPPVVLRAEGRDEEVRLPVRETDPGARVMGLGRGLRRPPEFRADDPGDAVDEVEPAALRGVHRGAPRREHPSTTASRCA